MAVLEVSSRQFREKQKSFFDLADSGVQILLRRGRNRSYILMPVEDNDLYFTPKMIDKIERAKQQATVKTVKTPEELTTYLDRL
jgi:hypothetical protein